MSRNKARRVPPPPVPADHLRELSQHVAYEVKMLIGTATKLLGPRTTDWFDVRAQAESFLFHARALFQFFYWTPDAGHGAARGLYAVDYLPKWKRANQQLDADGQRLQALSQDVGKRVVHITVERVVGQEYQILDAARALLVVIRAFRDAKPGDFTADLGSLTPPWDPAKGFSYGTEAVIQTGGEPMNGVFKRAE